MKDVLPENLSDELQTELKNILGWWQQYMIDIPEGGFYGKVDHDNIVIAGAAKGAVLNARILWSFSAAAELTREEKYAEVAKRAYEYFISHFVDKEFGGVYWSVDHTGQPLETKKQTYALAFAVYGLSEYYKCSKNEEARSIAIEIYHTLLQYTSDEVYGGYFEAFKRDWQNIDDLRLSEKDANEKKSMNTHLHVIEAFVNLYAVWPDEMLKEKIRELLQLFDAQIIDQKTHHLKLFFTEEWVSKSSIISYGHDIEAAWLLYESAIAIEDGSLIKTFAAIAVSMAGSAAEGLDIDGGLWYEKENGHLIKQKHWWPQAEAMVGFFNAWQISQDESFLNAAINSWHFIKDHIIDKQRGEWIWGIEKDGSMMKNEDKAGLWKCPYHNSRGCIEMIKRIKNNR